MNISLFKELLKKEALECYNNALHSLYNNPFGEENIDKIKDEVILVEVKQGLGKNSINAITYNGITAKQLEIMQQLIQGYKNRIITKINSL